MMKETSYRHKSYALWLKKGINQLFQQLLSILTKKINHEKEAHKQSGLGQ